MGDRKPNLRALRSRAAVKIEAPVATDSVQTTTEVKLTKPKVKVRGKMVSVIENAKVKKQIIKNELEIKSEPVCDDEKPTILDADNVKSQQPERKNSKSPRKRKQTENDAVKLEKTIKVETADADNLKSQKPERKNSKSPRKRKQTENDAVKLETNKEATQDIEDIWQPENWRVVLENILKMRKMYVAPVDSLGCEECPEKDVKPEVFRYQTLISVMLSSQTRDEVTFAASQRLIEHGLTVDSILATPDEKIGELVYPAGFWKSKIKFIKNTTQILKDQYNGDIPRTFKELIKLPGVGPKMAHIVMSVAWNDTVGIAVDTHVHRISNRLGWVPKPTKDPEETRKALEKWLPKELWKDVSLDLVGFGQTICKPIKPKCADCLNNNLCPSSTCKKK